MCCVVVDIISNTGLSIIVFLVLDKFPDIVIQQMFILSLFLTVINVHEVMNCINSNHFD